jgi:predicted transcriptional regulator
MSNKSMINLDAIDAIIKKHEGDKGHYYFLQELEEFENMTTEVTWDMDDQAMEMHEEEMSRQDLDNAVMNNNKGEV